MATRLELAKLVGGGTQDKGTTELAGKSAQPAGASMRFASVVEVLSGGRASVLIDGSDENVVLPTEVDVTVGRRVTVLCQGNTWKVVSVVDAVGEVGAAAAQAILDAAAANGAAAAAQTAAENAVGEAQGATALAGEASDEAFRASIAAAEARVRPNLLPGAADMVTQKGSSAWQCATRYQSSGVRGFAGASVPETTSSGWRLCVGANTRMNLENFGTGEHTFSFYAQRTTANHTDAGLQYPYAVIALCATQDGTTRTMYRNVPVYLDAGGAENPALTGGMRRYHATFSIPNVEWFTGRDGNFSGTATNKFFVMVQIWRNCMDGMNVERLKLEEGPRPTDFVTDTGAKPSNTLRFTETDGLIVGDYTAAALKGNVQITADPAVKLRNGTTALAAFKTDGVDFDAAKAWIVASGTNTNITSSQNINISAGGTRAAPNDAAGIGLSASGVNIGHANARMYFTTNGMRYPGKAVINATEKKMLARPSGSSATSGSGVISAAKHGGMVIVTLDTWILTQAPSSASYEVTTTSTRLPAGWRPAARCKTTLNTEAGDPVLVLLNTNGSVTLYHYSAPKGAALSGTIVFFAEA